MQDSYYSSYVYGYDNEYWDLLLWSTPSGQNALLSLVPAPYLHLVDEYTEGVQASFDCSTVTMAALLSASPNDFSFKCTQAYQGLDATFYYTCPHRPPTTMLPFLFNTTGMCVPECTFDWKMVEAAGSFCNEYQTYADVTADLQEICLPFGPSAAIVILVVFLVVAAVSFTLACIYKTFGTKPATTSPLLEGGSEPGDSVRAITLGVEEGTEGSELAAKV